MRAPLIQETVENSCTSNKNVDKSNNANRPKINFSNLRNKSANNTRNRSNKSNVNKNKSEKSNKSTSSKCERIKEKENNRSLTNGRYFFSLNQDMFSVDETGITKEA